MTSGCLLILDRLTPVFSQSRKRAGPKIKKNKQKHKQEHLQFDWKKAIPAAMPVPMEDDLEVNYKEKPLSGL